MFTNLLNQRGFYFSPAEPTAPKPKLKPAPAPTDPTKPDPKEVDETPEDEDDDNADDEEATDDEEDDEEVDEDTLDPAVKKLLAKARKKTEEETAARVAKETSDKIEADRKKAQRAEARKKALKDGDKDEQLRLATEENADLSKRLDALEADRTRQSDEGVRLKLVTKYKLPDGYEDLLGSDPAKYEENAKKHSKNIKPKAGPNLEGGNQNNRGSKENQDKVAQTTVAKWKF